MSADFLDTLWVGLAAAVVGAAINEVVHRLRTRSALVTTVADRYIAEVGTGPDTPAFRLGTMQRSGVALLGHRQVKTFVSEVTGRGCTNPFKDSDIDRFVPLKKFPFLLRAASERGVSLSDDVALHDFLHLITNESRKKQRSPENTPTNNDFILIFMVRDLLSVLDHSRVLDCDTPGSVGLRSPFGDSQHTPPRPKHMIKP